jgi:hypothetical protein
MWNCHDPKIAYLRKFGYNVISLPRGGIRPLTVAFLQDKRRLTELGYLPEIWSSPTPPPQPMTGEGVANIGGQSTDKLQARVGLDILSNLVQALGADPVGVEAQYGGASALAFHFTEVQRERITAFALGKYLARGKLSAGDPFVERYFRPEEQVYVVTEVLKSSGFGVSAFDASQAGLAVDLPALRQVVSAKAAIQVESSSTGGVEFRGDVQLPFAFIAAQVTWNTNRWEVVDFPDPGEIALAVSQPPPASGGGFATLWKGGTVLFGGGAVDFGEPAKVGK